MIERHPDISSEQWLREQLAKAERLLAGMANADTLEEQCGAEVDLGAHCDTLQEAYDHGAWDGRVMAAREAFRELFGYRCW